MKFFDIVVAKEYESTQSGSPEIKTAWNRVGRAWHSRSGDQICFELFLIPNQRYVVALKSSKNTEDGTSTDFPNF